MEASAAARPFRNKLALVTGGGRGLGEAIAQCLAQAGATVVVADLDEAAAQRAAAAIRTGGGHAEAIGLDVTVDDHCIEAMEYVIAAYDGIDFLINNAGTDVTLPIDELTVADWDRVLAVNLRGPFLLSKHAVPWMKRRGLGHIVNIVSTAAKRTWPNAAAYHASKYGLLGLSHALHAELRPHNIKVTAIVAGGMRTSFILDRFPDVPPDVLQDPRNVAETVRFVLSQPAETVIPEVLVIPMRETSWP